MLVLETVALNAAVDAITARVDLGSNPGKLVIGTTNLALPSTGILAQLTFSATAFAAAVDGKAVSNAITDDTNNAATGTAAKFFVCSDNAGTLTKVWEGTVGQLGGGDLQLNNINIEAGKTTRVDSVVIGFF